MFGIPRKCEFCQSPSLRVSRTAKLRWLARLFLIHPIRCLECNSLTWRVGLFPPRRGKHHSERLAPGDPTPLPDTIRALGSPDSSDSSRESIALPAAAASKTR